MKQATSFIAFIVISTIAWAIPVINNKHATVGSDSSLVLFTSMQQMLLQVTTVTGGNEVYELKEADVLNMETMISRKKRYIVYNPAFIAKLNELTKNKWSVITLLAHEIGHHTKGHTTRRGGSNPEVELEADEFAGSVMYKLGATLQEAQNVMYFIARKEDSKTHPSRSARLSAIEKGWKHAAEQEMVAIPEN